MISLADIAFLIIFFFLLTSTFMKDRIPIALPTMSQAAARTQSQIIVAMDAKGKITLNGAPVASADVLELQVKGLLGENKKPEECEVRFRCDRALKYKDYSPVYGAISNAGGIIAIVHDVR
jgi:biopolymer transport protein ExbD